MGGSTSGTTTALIAGGFAVVGFIAAAWQSGRSIRASQQSAREQRLWDKKAALYESLMKALEALPDVKTPSDFDEIQNRLSTLDTAVALYASDLVRNWYNDYGLVMQGLFFVSDDHDAVGASARQVAGTFATRLRGAIRDDVQQGALPISRSMRLRSRLRLMRPLIWMRRR